MAMQAKCGSCGNLLTIPEAGGGQVVCPSCGTALSLASGGAPPPGAAHDAAGQPGYATAPSAGLGKYLPLITGGVAAVALIMIALLVLALVGGGGGTSAEKYLPYDSSVVAVVNVQDLIQSDVFEKHLRNTPDFERMQSDLEADTGMKLDDIGRLYVGMCKPQPGARQQALFVIQCRRDFDPARLLASAKEEQGEFQDEEIGGATIHVGRELSLHFPDNRTIVGGETGTVRRALDSDRKRGLNPEIRDMMKGLDRSRCVAVALAVPSDVPPMPGAAIPPDAVQKVRGVTFHADLASDVQMEATLHCKDNEAAESIQKMADGFLELGKQSRQMPDEVRELVNSIQIKASGSKVEATMKIGGKMIDDLTKKGPALVPGL